MSAKKQKTRLQAPPTVFSPMDSPKSTFLKPLAGSWKISLPSLKPRTFSQRMRNCTRGLATGAGRRGGDRLQARQIRKHQSGQARSRYTKFNECYLPLRGHGNEGGTTLPGQP